MLQTTAAVTVMTPQVLVHKDVRGVCMIIQGYTQEAPLVHYLAAKSRRNSSVAEWSELQAKLVGARSTSADQT